MTPNETREQKMIRISAALDKALRRQATGAWGPVRTSDRSEAGGHAWKFAPDGGSRFLRVSHAAMDQGDDPVKLLLSHLNDGRWLSRLDDGGETSLVLKTGGRLKPFSSK